MYNPLQFVDIILTTDFAPKTANPVAIMTLEKTLQFDLKIKNNAASGSDIPASATLTKNYDVDFYFSFQDLASTSVGSTTTYLLTNTAVSGALDFPLIGGATSASLLTFTAKGTLPSTNCNSYLYLCGCVKKGSAAAYTDGDTSNNCKCKGTSSPLLISCSPGKPHLIVGIKRWAAPVLTMVG